MRLPRTGGRILLIAVFVVGSGVAGYQVLLNPGSFWVRWAQAAFPADITMISFGPYPSAQDLRRFKNEGGRYVVSLLDPRLPYEKGLIEREATMARKEGLTFRDFPMASIFDRQLFPDYPKEEQRAVDYLKHLDGPAYVHCYLGRHRVIHVRDALLRGGVPARYWTSSGSEAEYWDLVNRLAEATKEFAGGNFAKVLKILEPIKAEDVDVAALRGWSHYRLGLYSQAAKDFQGGLKLDRRNVRNLEGLGFCDLQQGNPVMAQRKFGLVLEENPKEQAAMVGQGLAFLRLENKPAAAQMFLEVLAIDPGNAEVKGYLKKAEAE
jgi:tetratricopeptide (TPR) repeat protein